METEKLYYAAPFLKDFTATVLDCQAGKNGYTVTLDRTAFTRRAADSLPTTARWTVRR